MAELLNITSAAVAQWKRCPDKRVLEVEAATGGRVKRHRLRPDLYPPPAPRKRRDITKQKSAQPLQRLSAS